MTTFSAAIDSWVGKSKKRMDAVFKQSTQEVINTAQLPVASGGNMPVDTGFLRASGQAAIGAPAQRGSTSPKGDITFQYNPALTSVVIAKSKLGDTIYFTYSANYARAQHYGTESLRGRQWVTLAAQRWPQIVAKVSAEAKLRSGN